MRRLCWSFRASIEFAQILAQDFSDVRFRQRLEEAYLLWNLVGGELAPAVRDHVSFGNRRARRAGDEQGDGFAGLLVRPADAGTFGNARAGGGDGLDFIWLDVEAGDDDHVLLAVDDLQVAARIEHADIAGAEIAVLRESLRIGVRLLPVTLHHLRAPGADLAGF